MKKRISIATGKQHIVFSALSILLPCTLGTAAMICHKVPMTVWMQNPLAILLLPLIIMPVSRGFARLRSNVVVTVSIIALALTFFGPDAHGVHRWLRIPFFTLNVSAIILPVTIIALHRLIVQKRFLIAFSAIAVIALELCLQPDASQLFAFSLSVIVLLLRADASKAVKVCLAVVLCLLTLNAWMHPDMLEPVEYSEGILAMLRDTSTFLYIASLISLALMPICFLASSRLENKYTRIAVALYYWLTILSAWIGNFPVPFAGYGLSPILGFYLCFAALLCEERNAET